MKKFGNIEIGGYYEKPQFIGLDISACVGCGNAAGLLCLAWCMAAEYWLGRLGADRSGDPGDRIRLGWFALQPENYEPASEK